MFNDTALMRMIVEELAQSYKWSYEETIQKFYNSKTCKGLSDKRTGMFTFAPREIIDLFNEEVSPT